MDSPDSLGADYVQTWFEKFVSEFKEKETIKYLHAALLLQYSEQNALIINYDDVKCYNPNLAVKITEDFYTFYPFLKRAILKQMFKYVGYGCSNGLQNKLFYISFINAPDSYKINQLAEEHIGTLITVSGQVIAEPNNICCLLKKAFVCGDCNILNNDTDLSFMHDCPKVCFNVECENESYFIENSNEVIQWPFRLLLIQDEPFSDKEHKTLEVLVKDDMMNTVQNGGYYDFTGVLVTILQAHSPEELAEAERSGNVENVKIVLLVTGVQSKSCVKVRMQDSTASTSQAGSSGCSLRCIEELNQ